MVSAIITAAGDGIRFNGNKMLAKLNGKTILEHVVDQFIRSKKVTEILVTYRKDLKKEFERVLAQKKKKIILVEGGKERIDSAYNALKMAGGKIIVIHDGARPFVPVGLINKVIIEAEKFGAAICAVNPATTIKYGRAQFVEKSFLRKETWLAQTPQAFKKEILMKAYKNTFEKKYFIPTDDAELVGLLGYPIKIIEGCHFNLKITYPEDLAIANKLYEFIKKELE